MDRFPQILSATTPIPAGTNDYTIATIIVPRPLFGTGTSTTLVMELLWVDFFMATRDIFDTTLFHMAMLTTSTLGRNQDDASTLVSLSDDLREPTIIAAAGHGTAISTNGGWSTNMPVRVNLTDGSGNGVLVATSRMFLVCGSVSNATLPDFTVKIGYRQVQIGGIEFAGIVQSQISGTA